MSDDKFFTRIKTCEAKYGTDDVVRYVIFSTSNGLYLGVVVYMGRQLKGNSKDNDTHEESFPSNTEKEATDKCENWIRSNINNNIATSCKRV